MDANESELLRRWQEDDDLDALNRLLQIEIAILKQMIHSRRGRAAASAATSDIAQEAVMRLLRVREAPRFDDPRGLRGYLWRAAWNLMLQRFAGRRVLSLDADPGYAPGSRDVLRPSDAHGDVEAGERSWAIAFAMNLLPPDDATLLRAVYFEQADIATAGAALGLSRDVANTRLVRARRRLAELLCDWSDRIG